MEFTNTILYIFSMSSYVMVYCNVFLDVHDKEELRNEQIFKFIVDIMDLNIKNNVWNNILCVGHLPDTFYKEIQHIPFTFAVTNADEDDYEIEDVVTYYPNIIVMNCRNFDEFEIILNKAIESPYWHPLSNIILYYDEENEINVAKAFFALWYYKVSNVIIVKVGISKVNTFVVFKYSPYVSETYKLHHTYGCWTAKPLGFPLDGVKNGFICVDHCSNVTLNSTFRAENLGTCVGIDTNQVAYGDREGIIKLNLFENKAKNLHGFAFRANVVEQPPFLTINENRDGSYSLGSRDGMIWNTLSELMNFTIDLSPSISVLKKQNNYKLSIQQIFSMSIRKADLFLIPTYQYDFSMMNIDYTFPIKDSGVCFVSARADFVTIIFDMKLLKDRYEFFVQFFICFIGVWFVFYIFSFSETGRSNLDQLGKDFLNTIRNVLLINLERPPRAQSFRIFLTTSIWSFFALSFSSQAAIIALFTAIKRGKEVETFEDIVEKGYPIEGMTSPDLLLPENEELFRKISSKFVPTQNLFTCIENMKNDSHRFCVLDCSVGRYLERNLLNEKGEQYLHIPKDRIHSYYLNIILTKHSLMSGIFNEYIRTLFEAGLIKKWEQYRYNDIKDDVAIKPLGMNDLIGVFNIYLFCLACTFVIFVFELILGGVKHVKNRCNLQMSKVN